MTYTAKVLSDANESINAETIRGACALAAMLSEEFGWVDVVPSTCGPHPVIATFNNGHRTY